MMTLHPLWFIAALLLTGGLGYAIHSIVVRLKLAVAHRNARIIEENARREAEVLVREARVQARDEALQAREQQDQENWNRRQELRGLEERLVQREATLDRKAENIERRELTLTLKQHAQDGADAHMKGREAAVARREEEAQRRLEVVAGLTAEQAQAQLMHQLEEDLRQETGTLIRRWQEKAKDDAKREATRIITTAIQRYAGEQVSDMTTSAVTLPSDDMKGRIIGREGRNIKAFEAAAGVNLLIDDTPEVVVISAYDPLRREVARQALVRLMEDGRIHPTRIEEVVNKVQAEVDEMVKTAGEEAIYELGLAGLSGDVTRTLGRLKFRHSYGQNVLQHSKEMAHLMAVMASELGLDPALARRCGLLHDIGKAMDHSAEGGHAIIGAEFLRKQGESALVVNAVAAHHEEAEAESLYAVLVKAADAITAARPGARHENTEIYLKRLEKLEEVATRFKGVLKCYAIQAGREVRVLVEPGQVSDEAAMAMARDISKQIETELDYPGQIRVTVVRETRCVEYAR
jgi:ribonuclease Y